MPIQVAKRVGNNSHIRPIKDGIRFLLVIFKIATLYSPLKLFAPVAMAFAAAGLGWYGWTFYETGRFTNMSMLLLSASVIRSEAHTSELQSLMRISYAVFCLIKKRISNAQMCIKYIKP